MNSSLDDANTMKTKAQADRAEAALSDPLERTEAATVPTSGQPPVTVGNKKLPAES
jgi:hypothetical protein